MLRQRQCRLSIRTKGRGLVDVTAAVLEELRVSRIEEGLATLFIRHTSASLVIQENADPDVQDDLERFFGRLVQTAIRYSSIAAKDRMTCLRMCALRSQRRRSPFQ